MAHRLLVANQPSPFTVRPLEIPMRKTLSTSLLIACLAVTACSDHVGTVLADKAGPEAPINDPDTVFSPSEPIADSGEQAAAQGPSDGGTAAGGGTDAGGSGGSSGQSGGSQSGGGGSPGGSNPGAGGGKPGSEPEADGQGGQPVPEPGTLLLVGSGLAGIGASLLRRRRRQEESLLKHDGE
jgi:hypothetical protein